MAEPERRRHALLSQLSHLIEEVEALREVIDIVPDAALSARPHERSRSVVELFALLSAADAQIYRPAVQQLAASSELEVAVPPDDDLLASEPWSNYGVHRVLDRVCKERRHLVDVLAAMDDDEWSRVGRIDDQLLDVYGLCRRIIQSDLARLRAAAHLLNDSRFPA